MFNYSQIKFFPLCYNTWFFVWYTLPANLREIPLPRIRLNPIQGGCKFAHPYLDVTKRKIWGTTGAPNFSYFQYHLMILDTFCENLAHVAPQLQIL